MSFDAVCIDKKKQLKFYGDWLEKIKKAGVRDPSNPFKSLPSNHPLTRRKIKELETHISFFQGKMSFDDYLKKLEEIEK